jgi:hypothetical protein
VRTGFQEFSHTTNSGAPYLAFFARYGAPEFVAGRVSKIQFSA